MRPVLWKRKMSPFFTSPKRLSKWRKNWIKWLSVLCYLQICNVDMQSDLEQLFTQLVSSLVESIQESLGSVHTMVDAYVRLEI